jgi:hypothetical protein
MGEYIGKVLSEIKARPVYFVAEHTLRTSQGRVEAPPVRADDARERALGTAAE